MITTTAVLDSGIAPPAENPSAHYTQHAFEGGKYKETENLRTCEVAKLIRKELKERFPGFKLSVRTQTFAGGSSIDVVIKEFPEGFNPFCDTYHVGEEPQYSDHYAYKAYHTKYNEEAEEIKTMVERVMDQYNFNDSDGMIDYFHVSFYGHASFDYRIVHPNE